jgi:two-component system, chemotaxis family, CheB/CheR fusion protein
MGGPSFSAASPARERPGPGTPDTAEEITRPAAAQSPLVVLHVEDDEQLGASVAAFLRAEGHEALTARDGPSALERIVQSRAAPDVLIMDFNLPGEMDGADVTQEICRLLGHVVPTIFLSGELSNAAMPWLPGAPLLFVAKPVDPEILLKVVESFAALGRFIRSRAQH